MSDSLNKRYVRLLKKYWNLTFSIICSIVICCLNATPYHIAHTAAWIICLISVSTSGLYAWWQTHKHKQEMLKIEMMDELTGDETLW